MAIERPLERFSTSDNGANGRAQLSRATFDPALTVEEVADRLKVSPATVYALLRAGALTSYKVGRSWRVDELDLVEYIERQKARHGAELSAVAKAGDGEDQRPE